MISCVEFAVKVISSQTAYIRKKLKKNRCRMIYLVQNEDCSIHKFFRSKYKAIVFASHNDGANIFEGRQKANWIKTGSLLGIKWNRKRVWYMPKVK